MTSPGELVSSDTELACLDDLGALAFVEGTCAPARRTAVIEHLDGCAECRELIAGIVEIQRAGEAPEPEAQEFGGFRLGALIAQGGMGRIYRAFDTTLGRDVALKLPRSASPALVRRFEREAAITARLEHPGIVPIHGAGQSPDGTPFYVMRLIEGRTLDALIEEHPDPVARLALVDRVISICDTMAYVHGKRIVHRDLKPNNVLVSELGETLIIDWGLAKRLADGRPSLPVVGFGSGGLDTPATREALRTRAGDVLGTPAFMPPEQAAGEPVDERGDVFSLGAILRVVLTGRLISPTEAIEGPPALVAVCKKALAELPEDRYAHAGEMLLALRAAAPRRARTTPPQPRRRLWPWLAAGGAVIVIGATIMIATRSASRNATARREVIARLPPDTLVPTLSPSGKRVAYGGRDRLAVRDLETGRVWTRTNWLSWPFSIELESDDALRFDIRPPTAKAQRVRWDLTSDTVAPLEPERGDSQFWIGRLGDGDLWLPNQASHHYELERADGKRMPIPSASLRALRLFAISPDRGRLAFVEHAESGEALRIVDARIAPPSSFAVPVRDVAALTWASNDTLLYAGGTTDGSTLFRARATADALAHPESVYVTEGGGWLGALSARNGRIVASWIASGFETRLHDRATRADRQLDKAAASAALGWRDATSYWVFNSATRQLERHSRQVDVLPVVAAAQVPGDPANATMAGELVIVTLRGGDGRQVIAIDPDKTAPVWTADKGVLAFVRCAGDRVPPCVAGKRSASGTIALVGIDPRTGTLGDPLVAEAEIADAAIDATGTQLAWVVDTSQLYVRPLVGTDAPRAVGPPRAGIHSIAFDPTGGILASVSNLEGRMIARVVDDRSDQVLGAGHTILSLIRPSPDGTYLLYRARTLTADLVEVVLP